MTTNPLLCVQTQASSPILLQVVAPQPVPAPVAVANVSGGVYTGTAGPSLSIALVSVTPQEVVADLSEAEDLLLARVFQAHNPPEETVDITPSAGAAGNQLMELMLKINRAATRIASRTRRGVGTTALMHESTFEAIRSLFNEFAHPAFSFVSSEPQNGWQHVGTVNGRINVYTSNKIPPGKAVVLYKGLPNRMNAEAIDFDGAAVYHEGNKNTLSYNEGGNKLGNADDYFQVVEIITEYSGDYTI